MEKEISIYQKFEESTGLNTDITENTILIGYCYLIEVPSALKQFMKGWIELIDKEIDKVEKHTEEYGRLISLRSFAYEEFKLLRHSSIKMAHLKRGYLPQQLYLDDDIALETWRIMLLEDGRSDMELYQSILSKFIIAECPELEQLLLQTKIPINIPYDAIKKHIHILGLSGVGKSELLKTIGYELQITSLGKNNRSIVLMDLHSDLATEFASFAMNKGDNLKNVIFLDSNIRQTAHRLCGRDVLQEDFEYSINPFEASGINESNMQSHVEYLAEAFFSIIDSKDTHQMMAVIQSTLEVLLRRLDSSISDLKRFMDDSQNADLVELGKELVNKERAALFNNFALNGKLASTKNAIFMRLLSILGNTGFLNLVSGKSTVDLEGLINSGKVVIFNISKASIGKSSSIAFGKLMIALLNSYAFNRAKLAKADRVDTFLIVDEFQNVVGESIQELLAETRKFHLFGTFANQQMEQNNMSTELKRIIGGNTALKFMSENDPDNLSWMCNQMRHVDVKSVESLPKHAFYFNNKFNKKAGTFICRVPDFLIDTKSNYYLSQKELEDFFIYQARESGNYRRSNKNVSTKTIANEYSNPFTE